MREDPATRGARVMSAVRSRIALAALPALLAAGALLRPTAAGESKYPRVNLARTWAVDPKWPQKPPGVVWGHVPGIAVDGKDNVYVFTRAKPPVQVYDAHGKYLRGWGEEIKNPHHIKVDPDGNVWITDIGNHVAEKYTPDGKLLQTLGTKGKAGREDRKSVV